MVKKAIRTIKENGVRGSINKVKNYFCDEEKRNIMPGLEKIHQQIKK